MANDKSNPNTAEGASQQSKTGGSKGTADARPTGGKDPGNPGGAKGQSQQGQSQGGGKGSK